jgi:hypothetical protein
MHAARIACLIAAPLVAAPLLAACSAGLTTGGINQAVQFEHTHTVLPSGKHRLTVTPNTGAVQNDSLAVQLAQTYANDFAARTCPKGYDYYAEETATTKRSRKASFQQTYIFECK